MSVGDFPKGVLLLFFYSIGLAIPFILSGYLIQRFLIFSKNFKKKIYLPKEIEKDLGPVEILINNAGVTRKHRPHATE